MSQQNQEHPDNMMIIMVFLLAAIFAIGYFFDKYNYLYIYYFIYVKKYIYFLLSYIPSAITSMIFFIDYNNAPVFIENAKDFLFSMDNKELFDYLNDNRDALIEVDTYIGKIFAPYYVALLLFFIYRIMNKKVFKRNFDMNALLMNEKKIWPQIEIVARENPIKENDLDKGKWAMGASPEKFLYDRDCVISYIDDEGDEKLSLDVDKLQKILEDNIGEEWKGVDFLSEYELEIFAMLISKVARDSKSSQKLNDLLALKYSSDKSWGNRKRIRKAKKEAKNLIQEILKKDSNNEKVLKAINSHFYKKTVFLRLLDMAREDGVLATASFLWLKIYDRELYYTLNNLGRKVGWPEVSGIWGHYLAEKYIGRKLPNKYTEKAIKGFDEFMFLSYENWVSIYEYEEV